jgi:hypothetical protein
MAKRLVSRKSAEIVWKSRSSVILLVAQERKVHLEHLEGVGAGFLLGDNSAKARFEWSYSEKSFRAGP